MDFNWNNIRLLETSQREAFEELVCQLARNENHTGSKKFIRKGKPDAGVECFWILDNGNEIAWQAKFFTSSLGSTQWNEMNDSVETALDKHPKLEKYIIAIPIDPSDGRLDKQTSLLQKWENNVKKWEGWAKAKGMSVVFEPWWSSDLIAGLRKPENKGLTYFFFNKDEFTDEWFSEQTDSSIDDLDKRYTSELNFNLEISEIFCGVARDEKFKEIITKYFDDFLIKGKKLFSMSADTELSTTRAESVFQQINQLFFETEFQGIKEIPYNAFKDLTTQISQEIEKIQDHYFEQERQLQREKGERGYYQKHGDRIRRIQEFSDSIYKLENFLQSTIIKLSNYPILLLSGEAGIGKSHLLGDAVRNRNLQNKPSIFLLGQHFVTDEDPWLQLLRKLDVRCSIDEFLGSLDAKAQSIGSRVIIFIDAINEGRGRYFWDKTIVSFINKILKYEWLGLVVSIRDSYRNLVFPQDSKAKKLVVEHIHYGFRYVEYEASKMFFRNYGIGFPSVPLLHPEFQNPLFLKLFCEALYKSGNSKIPDGLQGITKIIDFFLGNINDRLSKPDRLNYSSNINVVRKAIDALISEKIDKNLRYVPYETAFELADSVLARYSKEKGLLDEMISEGILSKNLFWKSNSEYEEGVYLAYERFEDHLKASFLIDKYNNLEGEFSEGGKLFHLVENGNSIYFNEGLIEALSIQLPEKKGKEFYEFVPHLRKSYPVAEAFVKSLLWRKYETISEKQRDYVNEAVFLFEGTHDLFWDTILSVTAIPEHYFNALSLNRYLSKFSMSERDSGWTQHLKYQFDDNSAVKRLIDWGWSDEDKSYISDESIKLASITLAWFLTSTNRKLRDASTKALICLLENRIHVLIEVLEVFESVNDPYVYERLFAVAYGCAVRTTNKEHLLELSEYVFKTIFEEKEEIYPHILLRDYAREIIEFTAYNGFDLPFDIELCRPPYKSDFPSKFPTNEEIDEKYDFDYQAKGFKDYYWAQNHILSSMTTEYGRGIAGYGDFGRYTFQSALENWDVNPDQLSNLAVEWIFEKYGYDVEKHGEFDRTIGTGRGRGQAYQERIGKKYQWIAFHEMLARVSDNFTKYERWSFSEKTEEKYEGPWNPYVRDIDPTMTIRFAENYLYDEENNHHPQWWTKIDYSNWILPNNEWMYNTEDLPDVASGLSLIDNCGEEWLVLKGYPSWNENRKIGDEKWQKPYKRLRYQIRSYLIKKSELELIKKWSKQKNFSPHRLPDEHSRYEIFSREFYWSPAYHYFYPEKKVDNLWQDVESKKGELNIPAILLTTESLNWEEEYDYSKEFPIQIIKPSAYVFKKMNLDYGRKEDEFINEDGKSVCIDPSVSNKSQPYLLIKKELFLKFLQENDLEIFWTVAGEKNIIGAENGDYVNFREDFKGWLVMKELYWFENENVVGRRKTYIG